MALEKAGGLWEPRLTLQNIALDPDQVSDNRHSMICKGKHSKLYNLFNTFWSKNDNPGNMADDGDDG
jgi:hypothetical protein